MIIDGHCHAWASWPYEPPVPDPATRGSIEQLLFEMDGNGVDQAVLICAQIAQNPDNNQYGADAVERFPGRFVTFADIDGRWSPTYHAPGAAERLADAADRFGLHGFTHYLRETETADADWLLSPDGLRLLRAAEERRLVFSLSCGPRQFPVVCRIAERYPALPILCHHLGWALGRLGYEESGIGSVLAAAAHPNVAIKISGFGYGTALNWDYPYADTLWVVRAIHEAFGAERMCWGSDYPVCRRYMTYRQSLEVVRQHCPFLSAHDLEQVLGGTLRRLLQL